MLISRPHHYLNRVLSLTLLLISVPLHGLCQSYTGTKDVLMDRMLEQNTSDLSEDWKAVRVLVSYNNTNFFEVGGQQKGLEAELMRQYEKYLRKGPYEMKSQVHVVFIALPFTQLIPALIEGRGDIVAAGLTITPERQKQVQFTDPYIKSVDEIVVTAKDVMDLKGITDLSGRKIHVVSGSSYAEHLTALNRQFEKYGLKPAEIVAVGETIESEDLMQMVNAGIFKLMVVDHYIAELWSKVLKNLVLRKDLKIHSGGKIAWAVRKDNPKLLSNLNTFVNKHREGTLLGNILIKRYYGNTKWVKNPLTALEEKKLEKLIGLFRQYAKMYGFDWLKIAALAYQESRLDPKKKSRQGAVGIMQIKPDTAADANVNIKDVSKIENNIHAGVKYLAFLRDRYFEDPAIEPDARVDFTFAAYNAGPGRVISLRQKAQQLNLDPNQWFFNVEHVARKEIGMETVQYVANVNKYYIAYKSMDEVLGKKTMELDKLRKPN